MRIKKVNNLPMANSNLYVVKSRLVYIFQNISYKDKKNISYITIRQ